MHGALVFAGVVSILGQLYRKSKLTWWEDLLFSHFPFTAELWARQHFNFIRNLIPHYLWSIVRSLLSSVLCQYAFAWLAGAALSRWLRTKLLVQISANTRGWMERNYRIVHFNSHFDINVKEILRIASWLIFLYVRNTCKLRHRVNGWGNICAAVGMHAKERLMCGCCWSRPVWLT